MNQRILGLDYGKARIGVALSDPTCLIASPLCTLQNHGQTQKVINELLTLIEKHSVAEVVIGMPLNFNGKAGQSASEVEAFIKKLQEKTSIKITTRDERLTTVQTERAMKSGKMNRKKRMTVIDSACAALILQNYLDQKNLPGSFSHGELLAHEV